MIPTRDSNSRLEARISSIPYYYLEDISVLVVTWNVNGKLETPENLAILFDCTCVLVDHPECVKPDIIVFNLQEVIELTAGSVVSSELIPASKLERIYRWQEGVLEALNKHDNLYEEMQSLNMLGLFMGVYALKPLVPHIEDVQMASLPRGLIGDDGDDDDVDDYEDADEDGGSIMMQ